MEYEAVLNRLQSVPVEVWKIGFQYPGLSISMEVGIPGKQSALQQGYNNFHTEVQQGTCSRGCGSYPVVPLRRLRKALGMISYNSCRSEPPQNSSWFTREVCDPNLSEASPCTQQLLPHCSGQAGQIPLQSLFEHARSYRREHKAVWHGLLFSFATLDMSVLLSHFVFTAYLFPRELIQERAGEALQKEEAQCVMEWPWGFCLCHCPRCLLINSKWNGFTGL